MKTISTFLVVLLLTITAKAGIISVDPHASDNKKAGVSTMAESLAQFDAQTFLSLTPAKVKALTGKKLNLGQRFTLKLTQQQVKRELRKGKQVNMAEMGKRAGSGVNFLWLLVGFMLGIVGVLIAYLTKDQADDNRVKSAWIGFGISAALVILIYVLIIALWAGAGSVY